MEITPNAFITGTGGLLAGNLLGSAVNRLGRILRNHINISGLTGRKGAAADTLDEAVALLLHVGALAVGAELVANAIPWITTEPGAYSMFMLGLLHTSDSLREGMKVVNRFFWLPAEPPVRESADPSGALPESP
ncbi:MAG: hypothetical protein WDA37_06885 [Dysgonamonadaceae bacterium]|jgi:hypothetical protein